MIKCFIPVDIHCIMKINYRNMYISRTSDPYLKAIVNLWIALNSHHHILSDNFLSMYLLVLFIIVVHNFICKGFSGL